MSVNHMESDLHFLIHFNVFRLNGFCQSRFQIACIQTIFSVSLLYYVVILRRRRFQRSVAVHDVNHRFNGFTVQFEGNA